MFICTYPLIFIISNQSSCLYVYQLHFLSHVGQIIYLFINFVLFDQYNTPYI